jgi:hypothetical protein
MEKLFLREDSKPQGLFKSLFTRRATVQQGPTLQDLATIAKSQGYELLIGKDGTVVPVPEGMDEKEMETLQNKWGNIDASSADLINNRSTRINEYMKMDRSGGEGAVLLDVLADEIINISDYSEHSLQIQISDKDMEQKVFKVLTDNRVLVNMRSDIRSMCKFGDFSYVFTRKDKNKLVDMGIDTAEKGTMLQVPFNENEIELTYLSPNMYELEYSSNKVFKLILDSRVDFRDLQNLVEAEYYPWEYATFSINSRDTFPYGLSELEKMRIPWQKLAILEELLAITRQNRLDKIAITIPGLKGDPTSVLNRLSQLKNTIRNTILGFSGSSRISRNQDTGMTDYLWVPEGFEAKKLSTSIEVSSIEDVEYFRDKVQNASRLPKGFFISTESGGNQRPMSLRQQDIKFARSLIPISESYCNGLKKTIDMIIFYLGGDISKVKSSVKFKKSPYITDELIDTYKGVYDIIQTYKEIKSSFTESAPITDTDVKRIMDLIGAPHTLIFPEQDGKKKTNIHESMESEVKFSSIFEASMAPYRVVNYLG